ncbi:MAG: biotin/lipoate A/B protein ligase family protein [Bernardetiaceae bacterium]
MIFIEHLHQHDPALNLALEEFVAQRLPKTSPYFLLYQNSPSVILGRNQNIYEEVDLRFADAQKIALHRRISGGGAVYHDLGNLNYSFLHPHDPALIGNWTTILAPLLHALHQIGVPAQLNYRNDILLEGKKISGTAQRAGRHLMISHGTLLVETDLERLLRVLNPSGATITSQSLKSFRSKVTNIKNWLPEDWDVIKLRDYLRDTLAPEHTYTPTSEDWQEVRNLAQQKYRSWDWNFGRSPAFVLTRETTWEEEPLTMTLSVGKQGVITNLRFSQEKAIWSKITKDLIQTRYHKGDLLAYLQRYFPDQHQTLIQFLY